MSRLHVILRDLAEEVRDAAPDDEESTPEERAAVMAGLALIYEQGRVALATRPAALPPRKPLVSALQPPATGDYWTIWRKLPDGVKPGTAVTPRNLLGAKNQYQLLVGASYIPASDWDGDVPDTLANDYAAGSITITAPSKKSRHAETLPLLWSRARSIAVLARQVREAPDQAARASHVDDHLELARILKKIPTGSGEMHDSVKAMYASLAPEPKYRGNRNVSIAEQIRAGRALHAAKKAALAAGADPEDLALAPELAVPAAPVALGAPIARNSFGIPGAKGNHP